MTLLFNKAYGDTILTIIISLIILFLIFYGVKYIKQGYEMYSSNRFLENIPRTWLGGEPRPVGRSIVVVGILYLTIGSIGLFVIVYSILDVMI